MAFIKGEKIKLIASFSKAPLTPVKIRIKNPAGNLDVEDINMTKDSPKQFSYLYTVQDVGDYEWDVQSGDDTIKESSFTVDPRKTDAS